MAMQDQQSQHRLCHEHISDARYAEERLVYIKDQWVFKILRNYFLQIGQHRRNERTQQVHLIQSKVYPSLLFMIVDMVKLQFAMSYYFHFRSICLTSGNPRNLIVISKTYSSFLTKIQKGSQINGIDQHTLNCVAHADCVISSGLNYLKSICVIFNY